MRKEKNYKMENNINNFDIYAKKKQEDLIKGKNPAHCFVEKPMMKSMLPNLKNKKILLLGCGTGEESKLLELCGASAKQIIGLDLSAKSIEIAKNTYPEIEFVVGNMNNLPFENNSFDFVYSSLALHYSSTPEKVYKEVYRIIKTNGLFLFSIAHPLRWSSEEKNIDNDTIRITGCSKKECSNKVYGKYNSFEKHIHTSFAWQSERPALEFYVGPPSLHFKQLRKCGFEILDFTESKCIEEAKKYDMNYYIKNSEIPQFMAFLAKK